MLNPKHSTIPANRKKINSMPAKTGTHGQKDGETPSSALTKEGSC